MGLGNFGNFRLIESYLTVQLLLFLSSNLFVSLLSLAKTFGIVAALHELLDEWADGSDIKLLFKNKRLIEPMADAKKMMQG